jgi:hypothetical protein
MSRSQSEQQWNANCDTIKKTWGGQYPPFWFSTMIASGLGNKIAARWGGDTDIHVYRL